MVSAEENKKIADRIAEKNKEKIEEQIIVAKKNVLDYYAPTLMALFDAIEKKSREDQEYNIKWKFYGYSEELQYLLSILVDCGYEIEFLSTHSGYDVDNSCTYALTRVLGAPYSTPREKDFNEITVGLSWKKESKRLNPIVIHKVEDTIIRYVARQRGISI
jgi:hypothetical protein